MQELQIKPVEVIRYPFVSPVLSRLATDDSFAKTVLDRCCPDLEYVTYWGKPYLLRGQVAIAWNVPKDKYYSLLQKHQSKFEELGLTLTMFRDEVSSSSKLKGRIDRSFVRWGGIWLYSTRAVAFTAFLYDTPESIAFQLEAGITVPIGISAACKYSGVDFGGDEW